MYQYYDRRKLEEHGLSEEQIQVYLRDFILENVSRNVRVKVNSHTSNGVILAYNLKEDYFFIRPKYLENVGNGFDSPVKIECGNKNLLKILVLEKIDFLSKFYKLESNHSRFGKSCKRK